MKQLGLLAVLTIAMSSSVFANKAHYQALLEQGNNAYSSGAYDSAAVLYAEVIGAKWESHTLYYNYGNALFRIGDVPNAILFYEKALKLEPGNQDTRHNLSIAKTYIVDRIEQVPTPFFERIFNKITGYISLSGWGVLTLITLSLLLLAAGFFYQTNSQSGKKRYFVLTVFAGSLFLLTLVLGSYRYYNFKHNSRAVVLSEAVAGYSEPGTNSAKLFVIHAGLTVKVDLVEFEWARITLPDGNVGWIPADSFEVI